MSEQDTALPRRWGRVPWIVAAALLVLALVIAAGVLLRQREPAAPPPHAAHDAQAYAESAGEPTTSAAPRIAAPTGIDLDGHAEQAAQPVALEPVQRQPALTSPSESATSAIATLLPLAESGRAAAMNELARRLMACRNFVDATESSIRRNVLQRFYSRNGREPDGDADLTQIAAEVENVTLAAESCRGIDPALMDKRINWMERAARAGDIGAMLDYAGYSLNDMRGYDDVLENFDEVARRRQLAGELLRGALDRGACMEGLPILAAAYSGQRGRYGWLFKADAYLALVYAEAASQAGISQERLAAARQNLPDPARQAAAAEHGRALMESKCAGSY